MFRDTNFQFPVCFRSLFVMNENVVDANVKW